MYSSGHFEWPDEFLLCEPSALHWLLRFWGPYYKNGTNTINKGVSNTITFTVNQKPAKAGIDPYNKLIDRVPEDNLIDVEEE